MTERKNGLKLSRTEYIGYLDEDHVPVVDMAQEVVRCRDCVHMRETTMPSMLFNDETFTSYRCGADQWSTASLMPMHSIELDGYCAWAKRRDT